MSEIAPGFLVAVPQLGDPNFQRTLVLMIEHSDKGAMGIVVNRPATLKLSDVARDQGVAPRPSLDHAHVFVGGPVEPERGFVVHDLKDLPESVPVLDGLFVSGTVESLRRCLEEPPDHFRLCLGYAGWGPGQIEKELSEGAWITATVTHRHVLSTPPGSAWEAVLKDMGIDPLMLLHTGGTN